MKRFLSTSIAFLFFLSTRPVLAISDFANCMVLGTYETCKHLCEGGDIQCHFPPAQYFRDIPSLLNVILPNLLLLAGIILFILVVVAGIQMIAGAGNGDAKVAQKWRQILTYGVVGFLLVVFAYVFIQIIGWIFGVDLFSPNFDPTP